MCLVAVGLASGCSAPMASTEPPSGSDGIVTEPARTDGEAGVAAAAAVARLTTDDSFGGAVVFDRVNIVERYGSLAPPGNLDVDSNDSMISAEVRTAIERALAPMAVTWVGRLSDVIGSGHDIPTFEDVGAVLTLSAPVIDDRSAVIRTDLWCGGTCGIGGGYALEWSEPRSWVVIGSDGLQWMS